MKRSLWIAAALLPFSLVVPETADANCWCRGYGGYYYYYRPQTPATTQAPSATPAGPPTAPSQGYTYRSYSVQPRATAPAPSTYGSSRSGATRSQDSIINRKLRPGTYSFH